MQVDAPPEDNDNSNEEEFYIVRNPTLVSYCIFILVDVMLAT